MWKIILQQQFLLQALIYLVVDLTTLSLCSDTEFNFILIPKEFAEHVCNSLTVPCEKSKIAFS